MTDPKHGEAADSFDGIGEGVEEFDARARAAARRAMQIGSPHPGQTRSSVERNRSISRRSKRCATRAAPARSSRRARFERTYYTHFLEVMTLVEFARKLEELDRW